MRNNRLTAQHYVDRSKWERMIEEKALKMAKDELLRRGVTYPTGDPNKSPHELLDAIEEYGRKETAYYMQFKAELRARFATKF